MNSRILINYRRDDSLGSAGRLYDRLSNFFTSEKVFMDVDTIEPGEDFVKVIEKAVSSCDVFIAVIGPDWLTMENEKGQRRIDDPDDFVRLEIVSALERDIRVIPVLVEGAKMPQMSDLPSALKPLARRNAIEISHTRFDLDANRLISAIERALEHILKERKTTEEVADRVPDGLSPAEAAERQAKIAKLMTDAGAAVEREDWNTARKMYRYVLMAQPDHAAAQAGLRKAQHHQKLADLYGRALVFQDNKQLEKALDTLKQILNLDGSYKDVRFRIRAIEDSLAQRIAPQVPPVSPPLQVDENSNLPIKGIKGIPRWIIFGGSGLGLLIIISIVCISEIIPLIIPPTTNPPPPTSVTPSPSVTPVLPLATSVTPSPTMTPVLPLVTSVTPVLPPPTTVTPTTTVTPSPTLTPTQPIIESSNYDLAFSSNREGGWRIYQMDPDNPNDWIKLPRPGGYDKALWPSFCGDRLAAEVQGDTKTQWIYLLSSNGATEKWDPPGSPDQLGVPRCSPNGNYLSYSAYQSSKWMLTIAELFGGNKILSDDSGRSWGYTSWFPNNREILSLEYRDGTWIILRTKDFNISNTSEFTPAKTEKGRIDQWRHPAISPWGNQVAFNCEIDDITYICLAELDSNEAKILYEVKTKDIDDFWETVKPAWSADGNWIYFNAVDGGDWDILRIRPDGGSLENVTKDWNNSDEFMPALRW